MVEVPLWKLAMFWMASKQLAPSNEAGAMDDGKRVASVRLHSTRTHKRVMTVLPSFRTRTGTVVVTVVSTDKKVQIDGLVVSGTTGEAPTTHRQARSTSPRRSTVASTCWSSGT